MKYRLGDREIAVRQIGSYDASIPESVQQEMVKLWQQSQQQWIELATSLVRPNIIGPAALFLFTDAGIACCSKSPTPMLLALSFARKGVVNGKPQNQEAIARLTDGLYASGAMFALLMGDR